jgi:hypothetical protein
MESKYKTGNVKRVGWIYGLDEQGIWIKIDHGTLLVWILNFCLMVMWLGIAQKGEF